MYITYVIKTLGIIIFADCYSRSYEILKLFLMKYYDFRLWLAFSHLCILAVGTYPLFDQLINQINQLDFYSQGIQNN